MPPPFLLTPKAIRERFADRTPVSQTETTRLLEHARRLTQHRKQEELRVLLVEHNDQFEPAARAQVRAFLAESAADFFAHPRVVGDGQVELLGPSIPSPLTRLTGSLWGARGPTASASQGRLGDCFLLASADALAHRRPQAVREALRDNRDGTYTARFFQPGRFWFSAPCEEKVTVDGRLPEGGARSDDAEQNWVGVLEKAFAQHRGGWSPGYASIARGGLVSEALFALTGKRPITQKLFSWTSTERLQAKIDAALAEGRPVVVGTPASDRPHEVAGPGIHPRHAYSVLERCGTTLVLRNPWGKEGESPRVEVELADLARHFDRLYLGG